MGDALVLIAFVGYFLVAVLLRRWVVLLVPAVIIPRFYGLHVGWWGYGFGSNGNWWEYAAFVTAVVIAVGTVLIGIAKLAAPNGTRVVNLIALVAAAGAIVITAIAVN